MTSQERHIWYDFLRNYPLTINRQKVIGHYYIVDFYCAKAKIVIELDSSQHYDKSGKEKDKIRDDFLNSLSISVLRYSNRDINENFKAVCCDIDR